MSEIAPTISPLALSVLELLDERAMHPYELASTMRERHHDEFIRLNFGTLYHTVEMLERTGMIASVEREKEGRRPERTIYQLTEPGRELLVSVVSDILARPTREYVNFAAGLMFMHHLDAPQAAQLLTERVTALGATGEKLTGIMGELHAAGVTRLALIELEHKIAMLKAERDWVRKLEREITDGTLEWRAGMGSGHEVLRRRHGSSTR
ncbi:MAG TPA: PadR family transcriptional regulator [Candidatus Dormibacteraeota bacterium]